MGTNSRRHYCRVTRQSSKAFYSTDVLNGILKGFPSKTINFDKGGSFGVNKMSWKRFAVKYDPLEVGSIDGTDKEPHDMGIVRALNSEYTPNTSLSSKPECTVFVGRLHPKVTEEDLKNKFEAYGTIKRCNLIRDLVTGRSKQYAFIEYEKESQASRAYRNGHRALLRGLEIIVDMEFGRTMEGWKPRRLGGGFGGRKESGQLRFGCRDRPWKTPIVPGQGRPKSGNHHH